MCLRVFHQENHPTETLKPLKTKRENILFSVVWGTFLCVGHLFERRVVSTTPLKWGYIYQRGLLNININIEYMDRSQEMKNAKTLSARVFYICDLQLFEECDKIPNIRGRVSRSDL
jgi:hypothetical protein